MTEQLYRFSRPMSAGSLAGALRNPSAVPKEVAPFAADLNEVDSAIDGVLPDRRSAVDAEVAVALYRCTEAMPRALATDMRFWHWMCVARFQDFVWTRWADAKPDVVPDQLNPAMVGRFLGPASLGGVSRNALARLWWCAASLMEGDDDALVRTVLGSQDLFQAIFERRFGLYGPAARACARRYGGGKEKEWRDGTKRLNHLLTTIVLETLDEDDVADLLG